MIENNKFDPLGPWTRIEVEAWINQNIIPNIQNYKDYKGSEYFIDELVPLRKIGLGEYSYASIKYYGKDLNIDMWNIDIGIDKRKSKYMLCIGGPFDKTYENQWYASEHGYKCFNQAGHTGEKSTRDKKTSSVLIHEDLLK